MYKLTDKDKLTRLMVETNKIADSIERLHRKGAVFKGFDVPSMAIEKIPDMINELEGTMFANIHKIVRERIRLEKKIGSIDDVEIRMIARLRVIDGMSWEDIGYEINMDRSAVARKFKKEVMGLGN